MNERMHVYSDGDGIIYYEWMNEWVNEYLCDF